MHSLLHQCALVSCEFYTQAIFYIEVHEKIYLISIFSVFCVLNYVFVIYT